MSPHEIVWLPGHGLRAEAFQIDWNGAVHSGVNISVIILSGEHNDFQDEIKSPMTTVARTELSGYDQGLLSSAEQVIDTAAYDLGGVRDHRLDKVFMESEDKTIWALYHIFS